MCRLRHYNITRKALIVCDEPAAYDLRLKTIKYFENMQDDYSALEQKLSR